MEHPVYENDASLTRPIQFYQGTPDYDQAMLFGGAGQTGIPSQSSPGGTGFRDGIERCARGVLSYTWQNEGVFIFNYTVAIPGIPRQQDSGGFVAIENKGNVEMVEFLTKIYRSGEGTNTAFEFL
ncbi:MAG: hypothetical protein IT292_02990 [Deltaproteobacteria bacterium]|nr:hypothetical protein [Deltaproteobacteria bacterium]